MAQEQTVGVLHAEQLRALRILAERGTERAAASLSEMVGQRVVLRLLEIREVPLPRAFEVIGTPEAVVVAVYVGFEGDLRGHVALIFDLMEARRLVDMLTGEEPGTTSELGEIGLSALAEVGNLTGSMFVNTLADALGMTVHVIPPAVAQDMAAAIISTIAAEVGQVSDVLIAIRTEFSIANRAVNGEFLVIPDPQSLVSITRGVPA